MNNNEIVQKLWNMANVLRDDGISYQNYVTELTYILFLKMMHEQDREDDIPEEYRWESLVAKEGLELMNHYKQLLLDLGNEKKVKSEKLQLIYTNATTFIDEPVNLEKIIKSINELDWYSAKEEGLGDLYEGLLKKNAEEITSGAGQYFTPRVLIDVIVELMNPQLGEKLNDPCCGTFGFMVAADHYLKANNDYDSLSEEKLMFQQEKAMSGMELVANTHKLALMNALLHDIDGDLRQGDTLSSNGKWMKNYDLVLTNPPFGTKKSGERATRDDITYESKNKQLNFLQVIYNSLNEKGRAAVVLPDNVLFETGVGEAIRKDLLNKFNLHTILRLPKGIFYAQGVQTNVLFFERGEQEKDSTKEIWFYDMRANQRSFGKRNPLNEADFKEFIECYKRDDISNREETYSEENPNGRFRKFTIEEILKRNNTSLDISWIETEKEEEELSLEEILVGIEDESTKINEAVVKLKDILGK